MGIYDKILDFKLIMETNKPQTKEKKVWSKPLIYLIDTDNVKGGPGTAPLEFFFTPNHSHTIQFNNPVNPTKFNNYMS